MGCVVRPGGKRRSAAARRQVAWAVAHAKESAAGWRAQCAVRAQVCECCER